MKFLLNAAFLASLAVGNASGSKIKASDVQMEDLAYWRELVDNVDSFPATQPPTASPTLAPVAPTAAPVESCSTIFEILDRTPEFETLTALIRAAGIQDILSEDNLTIFAPTNSAFDELSTELIQSLLVNNDLLQFILFGHVVARTDVLLRI